MQTLYLAVMLWQEWGKEELYRMTCARHGFNPNIEFPPFQFRVVRETIQLTPKVDVSEE
jgi:hypothetical protein